MLGGGWGRDSERQGKVRFGPGTIVMYRSTDVMVGARVQFQVQNTYTYTVLRDASTHCTWPE